MLRAIPFGRVGDQAAIRGERPVSRVPTRVITTATTIMRIAVSFAGSVSVEPSAPSIAPKTVYPTIRPATKTTAGRMRPTTSPGTVAWRAW
jgi:hypothetical protein